MSTIQLNEQIAFLRKQKEMTQEELASALGVTNQAVSKWESAQCCPDIQLLPAIAALFEVSTDELLGCKPSGGLGDICLKIKSYFSSLPQKTAFESAYRLAALLHEAAATDGYKNSVPWREKDYAAGEVSAWGFSASFEPEGCTGRRNNSIFFSIGRGYTAPTNAQLRDLLHTLSPLQTPQALAVLYSLYGLTLSSFDCYVTASAIAGAAHLTTDAVEDLLKEMPVWIKEEDGNRTYRLDEAYLHLPPLLSFLYRL